MPSIQGEARPPAFGPHSKFGGGRLYLDSYLSYIFAIFSLKPHKKRSHPMHSLEILFSPTFWSSSNLGKAAITFLFLYYAIFGVFYGLPYCPKDWDDDKYENKYEEDCEDVYFTQQKIKHEIKQMLQAHKMYTKVITFVLGFYVATMMGRWWSQISKLPDITQVAMKLNALVCPNNSAETERAEEMKRRILRYCMLSYYLLMIEVNGPKTFKKSFIGRAYVCFTRDKKAPKYSTLKFHEVEDKGLLVGQEKDIFDGKSKDLEKYWWVPMNWACKLVQENLGMINYADEVVKSLTAYQHNLQSLLEYHMNPFPSLSRQVAHLACWAYILFSAFATQKFDGSENNYNWIMFFTGVSLSCLHGVITSFRWQTLKSKCSIFCLKL